MTIASKNGGLILKNGALATSCGCCGITCETDWSGVTSVVVEMTTGGSHLVRTLENTYTGTPNGTITYKESVFDFVGDFDGTHVLTKTASNVPVFGDVGRLGSVWKLQFSKPADCADAPEIILELANIIQGQSFARARRHWGLLLRIPVSRRIMQLTTIGAGSSNPTPVIFTDPSIGCSGAVEQSFTRFGPVAFSECVAGLTDVYTLSNQNLTPLGTPFSTATPFINPDYGQQSLTGFSTTHAGSEVMSVDAVLISL